MQALQKLQKTEYGPLVNKYLNKLQDVIEQKINVLDSQNNYGVYTFKTNAGEWVVNRQQPEQQMWLSSPISGPSHYDHMDSSFVDRKTNLKLEDVLAKELGIEINID